MIEQLTKRELQVTELVALGLTNKQIACELSLGVRTINAYVHSVLEKVGVNNRVRLTVWWLEQQQKQENSNESARRTIA